MRSPLLAALALVAGVWCTSAQNPADVLRAKYDVDPQHSGVGFTIGILRVAKVRGRFRDYAASVVYDAARPEQSSVTAVIKTASISTDMDFRDNHLRSPDFFDAAKYPTIIFQSDRVERAPGGLRVTGRFTMHGVTKTIVLPVALVVGRDSLPSGGARVAFETSIRLAWHDFGMTGSNKFNPDFNPATSLLADTVDVNLELFASQTGFLGRKFSGRTPPSIADTVGRAIEARGVDDGIRVYRALRVASPNAFNFSAGQLDQLRHQLRQRGKLHEAVAVLALNEELYPTVNGVSESLGDAYAAANDRERAVEAYRRALAVDSANTGVIEMLRHLAPARADRPPVRSSHGLAFDTRRSRLVLFGGSDSVYHALGDTWEWAEGRWTRLDIDGPAPRAGFAMSFDSRRGRVVLFGGRTTAGLAHDTWEFDGHVWTRVDTTGPPERNLTAMAFDESRGRAVLFSGSLARGESADTWEWDGAHWTMASETGPSARGSHSLVYDPQRKRVVLIGGYVDDGVADSWEWDGTSWIRLADGPAVFHSAAAFDPRSNRLLVFGGFVGAARTSSLWIRDGSTWSESHEAGPPKRAEHRGTYAAGLGFVIFGGIGGEGMSLEERRRAKLDDLWAFDGRRWTRLDG
jgi:polyisoprenoid-binding protein YceI